MEKYNPVIWTGRKELTTPRAGVSGRHAFVFQPEKRQQEARKVCQAEQVSFGARVKHGGSSHKDFIVGKFSDDRQPQLDALLQRIHLASEQAEPSQVSEGFRQEELAPLSAASSSSQQWQTAQGWWSNWEWTPGREQRWAQSAWGQQSGMEGWQEQTATTSAEAKQKAKAEKRSHREPRK